MTSDPTTRPPRFAEGGVSLPPERAFVIQLRAPSAGGGELFVGRAEHLASGLVARFGSVTELIGFVTQVLEAHAQSPAGEREQEDSI
jgi:hypothetical protein